jgi:inner membrane protein
MDPLTHGLLGALTSKLGFSQRIGRDALWVAAGVAVLPDFDLFLPRVLRACDSSSEYLQMLCAHRGITHSLIIAPVVSLFIAFIWRWLRRNIWISADSDEATTDDVSFWWYYGCVLSALAGHVLLDTFTSYGTGLLSPLTTHRYALDAVPIIDLFYTAILFITLVSCYVLRKKQNSGRATLMLSWIGFLLSAAYLFSGLALHNLTQKIALRDYQNQFNTAESSSSISVNAYPQLGTIFVWRVTIKTPDEWAAAKLNFLYTKDKLEWQRTRITQNNYIQQAMSLPTVKQFCWFTCGQTRAAYSYENQKHAVEFFDMRYGDSPASLKSLWSLRAFTNPFFNNWQISPKQMRIKYSRSQAAKQCWKEIWSP